MYVSLEREQVAALREVLSSALKELRVETRHTDTRAFRDSLYVREQTLESILAKLSEPVAQLG